MHELLPVAIGVVLGAIVPLLLRTPLGRIAALLAVSVVGGVEASFVSGEVMIGFSYVVIDVAQVTVAAMATGSLCILLLRRRGQRMR